MKLLQMAALLTITILSCTTKKTAKSTIVTDVLPYTAMLQNDINSIDINEQGNQHDKAQNDPYFKRSIDKTVFIRKSNGKIIDQVFYFRKISTFYFWESVYQQVPFRGFGGFHSPHQYFFQRKSHS